MIEIKMDEAGYEVYYSLDDAVKAFSHNIALENATLDLDIGLILESDVDPFSNYGMEAISERVKEMASKAKSNFVLYAKKFINLLFGWLIRFFQGVVNIKKSMSSNYVKAKKYLEALNKYESQARQSSEKTVEITNAGNVVCYGLTVIQLIITSMKFIAVVMKDSEGNAQVDKTDGAKASKIGVNMYSGLADNLTHLYATISQLPTQSAALEKEIKSVNYVIDKLATKYDGKADNVRSKAQQVAFINKAPKNSKEKVQAAHDSVNEASQSLKGQFKAKIESAKKFMSTPERAEMKCPQAWDYLKTQLSMFIGIAKVNKWDVEKYVKGAENARRKLTKFIDRLSVSEQDEAGIKASLAKIVEVGNMTASMQTASGTIIKTVNSALNMMMTDVTKLGSILTTIGGGPAKDKDAEE